MYLFICARATSCKGRGLGSLAAFNTAILIIPATRNNILTFALRLPFDHLIVYHRFLGRFTIALVAAHFLCYYNSYSSEPWPYFTGVGAMGCGVIIFLSSMDYFRRNHFNVFYWAHYAFVGYLSLAFIHCPQSRPFISAGIAIFVADKTLRMLWMLWPRNTVIFRNKGSSIAQVGSCA